MPVSQELVEDLRLFGWNTEARQEQAIQVAGWIQAQSLLSGYSVEAIRAVLDADVTSALSDPDLYEMAGEVSMGIVHSYRLQEETRQEQDYVLCLQVAFGID